MPILTVLSLLELMQIICSYLTTSDFVSCALVNHRWSHLFLPYVWSSVAITTIRGSRKPNVFMSPHFYHGVARNKNYITSISSDSFTPIIRLYMVYFGLSLPYLSDPPNSATGLRKIDIDCGINSRHSTYQTQVLHGLLKNSPFLWDISLRKFPFYNQTLRQFFAITRNETSSPFPYLRKLSLHGSIQTATDADIIESLLINLPLQLEELLIHNTDDNINRTKKQRITNISYSAMTRQRALLKLTIGGDISGIEESVWCPFLQECPNLEEFVSEKSLVSRNCRIFIRTWKECCPNLSRLTLNRVFSDLFDRDFQAILTMAENIEAPLSSNQEPISFLDHAPKQPFQWKSLRIVNGYQFKSLARKALLSHCPTLEHLTFLVNESSRPLTTLEIMTILHDSPKLQSLVFFEDPPEYPRKVPFLDLGDLTTETNTHLSMNRPWACRQTLQILKLGVFSPRGPAATELRMAFMKQIGKLAVLRELGICNTPLYILYNSMNQPLPSHCFLYAQIHHEAIDKVSISRSIKKQDKLKYEEMIEVMNSWPLLHLLQEVRVMKTCRLERFSFNFQRPLNLKKE